MEVTDFELGGVNPVTFQIIRHRLSRVTDEAVEALKRVSGSPATNEGHDLMVALYTDDGELLTGGVGFLHHYVGASEAVKHVLEAFAGDINEGDVFLLNDPYTAALHPPDVYLIKPVFYEGELEAFAANFVHVADVGAIDPGGFSPNSTSNYHEGFQTPGLRLIEDGEMRQDVLTTILNMSRDPTRLELDFRSQIAANNVADDRLRDLFDRYGRDVVMDVGEGLIEHSEQKLRERLRDLPDGRWEERGYIESTPEDEVYTIKMALEKIDDELVFDFEGTSCQSEYGLNCTYIGTLGGVLAPVLPLLCHDLTWNDGILDRINVDAPSGTLVNAEHPAPVSIATVATLQVCNSLSTLAVSKLQGTSKRYADRATAVWHGAHVGVGTEVHYENGETRVDPLTDTFAGAGGARAFDDGVDLGGEVTNIVARWANVERHENSQPLVYHGRRYVEDSGGAGMFRGGVGHEFAVSQVDVDGAEEVVVSNTGRGHEIPQSLGVFGGYPGCTVDFSILEGAKTEDLSFPDLEDSDGRIDAHWGNHEVGTEDVFYVRGPGSGGYGDPIERDPERVAADVADGVVTPETAEAVYGVPVSLDGEISGSVEEARRAIVRDRLAGADGNESPIAAEETVPTDAKLGPTLDLVESGVGDRKYVACHNCGAVISPADENWKEYVAVSQAPVKTAGKHRETDEDVRLRQFACVSCGTLFDTEVAYPEDSFLESRLL